MSLNNKEQIGIINSTTQSHLIGSFYEIYFHTVSLIPHVVNGELQDWTVSRCHLSYIFLSIKISLHKIHTCIVLRWSVLYLAVLNQIQMNSLTEINPEEL